MSPAAALMDPPGYGGGAAIGLVNAPPPLILGIDPGKSGALAFFCPASEALQIFDVPTHEVVKNGKKHRQLALYDLARIIDAAVKNRPVIVWIEQVGAMPKQGVASVFDFGNTYGILQGICAAHFLRIERVPPATWKKALRVPAAKDGARAAAGRIFPRYAHLWARAKDDGRAEAAMIAYYGAGRS